MCSIPSWTGSTTPNYTHATRVREANAFLPKVFTIPKLGWEWLGYLAFRPQIRHRHAGFCSPGIWEQVCRYCVVACYSSTIVIWLHSNPTHRFNLCLPTEQRDPTTRPADPLVPANSRACSADRVKLTAAPTSIVRPLSSQHNSPTRIHLKHTRPPSKRDSHHGSIGCQFLTPRGPCAAYKPLACT
jgi:hypothetical protein